MLWFTFALLAQIFLAAASFGDKILLTARSLGRPATYAAAVGGLSLLILLAVPVLGFPTPLFKNGLLAVLSGALFIAALYPYYHGITRFEASRIVPAVGGLVPIFALIVSSFVFKNSHGNSLSSQAILALACLILGSVLITRKRGAQISWPSLKIALIAAPLFAIALILQRLAYLAQPFWSGLVWSSLGMGGASVMLFAIFAEVRSDFKNFFRGSETGGTSLSLGGAFLAVQLCGSIAGLLQNFAVYLVPPRSVAFVNALQGAQYVFLFIFAAIFSAWRPGALASEDFSRRSLVEKGVAILIIITGLVLLILSGISDMPVEV